MNQKSTRGHRTTTITKEALSPRDQYPKKSGETLDDGARDQAETPELWQAVEGDGSLVESRGRESVGFEESSRFEESFRFGRILLIRLDRADSGESC